MTARPYTLTPDDRAAILDNLAAGLHVNKAHFGKAAVLLASVRLQQEDEARRAAVKAATAAGEVVRAAQAEALRPKLTQATGAKEANDGGGVAGAGYSGGSGVVVGESVHMGDAQRLGETVLGGTKVQESLSNVVLSSASPEPPFEPANLAASFARSIAPRPLPPPERHPVPPEASGRLSALADPSKRAAEHTDDGAPDWKRFRREAETSYGPGRIGLYMYQDERLIKGGLPPTSPWWLKTMGEFFDSGRTWFLAMVGRGAGKSTNLERLLQVVVMLTEREVPTGQTWQCPFMSVIEKDAYRRIAEIKSLLLIAYGLELNIRGTSIKVRDCCGNEIEIVSTAGTIGQTSGPTTVGVFFDEAAKMHTADGAANRDTELIASIVGTSREQTGLTGWVGVRCSSAWETRGAHFANCMEGTNSENYVASIGVDFIDEALAGYDTVARWEQAQGNAHGAARIRAFAATLTPQSPNVATWVARPTLTALASRMKLETLPKDDPALEGLSRFDYWIREYGSMPLSRDGGPMFEEQCRMAADMTSRIAGRGARRAQPNNGPMQHPDAEPGDPRAIQRRVKAVGAFGNWRSRKAF